MKRRTRALALALLIALLLLAPAAGARAQARFEVMPTVEIPEGYDSWSLFLICNPAWLVQNGDAGIRTLFDQYKAFGDAIGPRNLAIWFWKEPAVAPSAELTDVGRSSTYCARYKLLPSRSPHVLVTTQHPDAAAIGDHFFVSLGGLDASDSAEVLAKLTDQLLVTGLNQGRLDASTRWQKTLAAAVAAVSGVGGFFNRVSFTFNTGFFKAEIAHSGP